MFCRNCGKRIPDGSAFCPVCRTSQSITEREYRAAVKNSAGAAVKRFREQSDLRKAVLVLEVIGVLTGLGGILFAFLCQDPMLTIGIRAMLCLLGAAISLGFGIALCVTLIRSERQEV